MTKAVLKFQSALAVLGLALLFCFSVDARGSGSYVAGVAVATIQLGVMIWSWERILAKKSIALVGTVIVFKYAFLGVLVFKLLSEQWVSPLFFLMGLGTMIPAIAVGGFLKMKTLTTGSIEAVK